MIKILNEAEGEELPNSYFEIAKKTVPLNAIAQIALFVLVILMVFKPF